MLVKCLKMFNKQNVKNESITKKKKNKLAKYNI